MRTTRPDPLYMKFPDLRSAIEDIQSNATCMDDIALWLKKNPWVIPAAQLYEEAFSWGIRRQQNFYRAYKDFEFRRVSMTDSDSDKGLRSTMYYWETHISYGYHRKDIQDDIDLRFALVMLGLDTRGVGGASGSRREISGGASLRVQAKAWYFVSERCTYDMVGLNLDAEKSGANRWFPTAGLGNLSAVQEALGSRWQDIQLLGRKQLAKAISCGGDGYGPQEFML